jgi:hypothetical protein
VSAWQLHGTGVIDGRHASCTLTIGDSGSWAADLATFTMLGEVDLLFVSDAGGHFCGPASVASSRLDSDPFRAVTMLYGAGPLMIVAPGGALPELPDGGTLDGEVVADQPAALPLEAS